MNPAVSSFDPDFDGPAGWAAMYRAVGINVVPAYYPHEVRSGEAWKRPCVTTWREFERTRIPDVQHERWYGMGGEHAKRWQMGIITGPGSGNIFVVDLDVVKHPEAAVWWRELCNENDIAEPETVHQKTGGGGRQIFFRAPPDVRVKTIKTSIGVDIRGQGGFAMLPPSRHESTLDYTWAKGCGPWECGILDAPPWLLAGVERLAETYGGGSTGGTERTANPTVELDAFFNRIDGREDYMTRIVWAGVLNWYRECPIKPTLDEQKERAKETYETYERGVQTRLQGSDKTELLEREGRGHSLFWRKWQRAMEDWDGKVAEEAARPSPRPEPAEARSDVSIEVGEALKTAPEPEPDDHGMATPFQWVDPSSIPPRAWVYGRHYIRKFISTTVAPGGVGKTALGVVEALAIASGKPLLGIRPEERTNVWLWNGEDPMEEMQRRVMATAVHYGMHPNDIDGRLFVDTGRETPIVIAEKTKDGATICAPIIQMVAHTLKANKIGLMVIDPFVACHRVTENDNSEIERVAKAWAQIADATNCAIELVHHVRKTNGNEVSVEDGRGATALLAAARSARALNRMTSDEAARAGVQEPGLYFRTDNGKANLAPPSSVATWYHLTSVDLYNDTPATETSPPRLSDHVGVVVGWAWPDPTKDVTATDLEIVRAAVNLGMWRDDQQASQWVGWLIIDKLGWDRGDPAHVANAKALQGIWTKNGALETYRAKCPDTRKEKTFVRAGHGN